MLEELLSEYRRSGHFLLQIIACQEVPGRPPYPGFYDRKLPNAYICGNHKTELYSIRGFDRTHHLACGYREFEKAVMLLHFKAHFVESRHYDVINKLRPKPKICLLLFRRCFHGGVDSGK